MSKNNTREELEKDSLDCLWYPFTQMNDHKENAPLIIEKGEGNYLIDIDGNKYLDGVSSLWTNVHGHNNKRLNDAIKAQVDKISHSTMLGLGNDVAIKLAKKLVEITPDGLKKVFYSDSGSSSVEIALKMAYQYQQQAEEGNSNKKKFISMKNAYHGDSIGAVSVGGIDLFHRVYSSLLFDAIHAEAPYPYRHESGTEEGCLKDCIEKLEKLIVKHHEEVCALVIEPLVQGATGLFVHPKGFLKAVRNLCTKYDIIMIADEVAVGFGKTGKMFACELEDVCPDIMTVAKGISGGYLPLAATITTDKIYNGFLGDFKNPRTFYHGHTYTGNPLACAAAIANIELFEEEKVLEKLQGKISYFTTKLDRIKNLKHVGDVRQCGVMVGIELVKNKETKQPFEYDRRIGDKVCAEVRKLGVIIRPLGHVLVLMPPLSISEDELKIICDSVYKSIIEVTEN